jgi:hypothetical protein
MPRTVSPLPSLAKRLALMIGPIRRLRQGRDDLLRDNAMLAAERDRALEEAKRSRAEAAEAARKAAEAEQRATRCESRMDGLREQRDEVAASALALVARVAASEAGKPPLLWLRTAGDRRTVVYPLTDGALALSPLTNAAAGRVCLITLPKAGTYLVGAFLKALGLVDTGVHVDRFGFSDYRHKSIEEMRADYLKFTTRIPIEVSAGLVAPGQFIVGHLEHSAQTVAATAELRRILLLRNPRDALVSYMRFYELPGRGEAAAKSWMALADEPARMLAFLEQWGGPLMAIMRGVLGWLEEAGVLVVRFEDLLGDAGPRPQRRALEAIVGLAGMPMPADVVALFNQVVGKPTKTWSGRRSEAWRYWNDRVEAEFLRLGGDALLPGAPPLDPAKGREAL